MPVAAVAVDGDRHVDVVEERGQRGRVGRPDLHRREVPAQPDRLAHRVERRAGLLGDRGGDHVGALLEVAAVERHQAERRPQLQVLLDAVVVEQLGEASHGPPTAGPRRPKVAVSTAARPSARSSPRRSAPDVVDPVADVARPPGDGVDGARPVAAVAGPHPPLVPAVVGEVEPGDHDDRPGDAVDVGERLAQSPHQPLLGHAEAHREGQQHEGHPERVGDEHGHARQRGSRGGTCRPPRR